MGKKGKAQGKPPKGRAAQRGKAQKASPRYNGWAQDFGDSDDNPGKLFKGFSQGTRRDTPNRNANVKLRHQAIAFVSAGSNTPAEPELEVEQEEIDASELVTNIVMDTDADFSEGAIGRMNIQSPRNDAEPELPFFVDTAGDPALQPSKGKKPVPRSPSPAPSSSSEEIVVFHGRKNKKPAPAAKATASRPCPQPRAPSPAKKPHITDALLEALGEAPISDAASSSPAKGVPAAQPPTHGSPAKGWAASNSNYARQQQASSSDAWQAAPSTPYWRKGKPRPDLDPQPADAMMPEDTPTRASKVAFAEPQKEQNAEDTISSLQKDWKTTLRLKKQENRGQAVQTDGANDLEVGDLLGRSDRRGKRGRKKDNRQLRQAIVAGDDEAEEAAYEDYMENMKAQLDAGELDIPGFTAINAGAPSVGGPSMVVDGQEIADDAVLNKDAEQDWEDDDSSSSDDDRQVGLDISDLSDGPQLNYSDLDSTDLEDELEYTEREQWEDEEDLRQRRQERMTDEQYARLLAKQLELGIEGDDLIIDDGVFDAPDDDMEGVGDLMEARLGLRDITNASSSRPNKRSKRSGCVNGDFSFPDASALADTVEQYGENGFDIMDFDRPSLRPTKKGRKGKLPAELEELSDDDLKDNLKSQWDNDRAKKRMKKAEREELRMQGLLGSSRKKGKADLSQKYLEGMTMGQVFDELRIFLQDDGQQSRPFPPMDKDDRKALHEVAQALNLKSKSVGGGRNRFPVLHKTRFTLEYEEATFRKVQYASSKGFLNNMSRKGKKKAKELRKAGGPGRGGGFNKAAVGIRDGQVVGGDAAELGRENFGHRLMEKMGWTKGTALGREGVGLLVPVEQVMRSGKAGLG